MTSAQAILAGAAFISASIFVVNAIQPAHAQSSGPFMLMHHSNTAANAGVFRIDTSTGDVSYCFVGSNGNLGCSAPIR